MICCCLQCYCSALRTTNPIGWGYNLCPPDVRFAALQSRANCCARRLAVCCRAIASLDSRRLRDTEKVQRRTLIHTTRLQYVRLEYGTQYLTLTFSWLACRSKSWATFKARASSCFLRCLSSWSGRSSGLFLQAITTNHKRHTGYGIRASLL